MDDTQRAPGAHIEETLRERNKAWRTQARLLRALHVILGISATALPLAAGIQIAGGEPTAWAAWFAFSAAAASGVLASFGIQSKGNRMRNAERLLTSALLRYEISPRQSDDMERLLKAFEQGEWLIGDVQESPGKTSEINPV